MASRYFSLSQSGSSEDSELEDDVYLDTPEKINMAHNELYNEDLEFRLANQIQNHNHTNLRNIFCPDNFISVIPDTLAMFSNLERLDLSNNRLTSVPDIIGQLSQLTHLTLTNNLLTEEDLPKSLTQLTKLRTLNLAGNQLEHIPSPVLELSSLRSLYLGGNGIREVPPQIVRLRRLKILYLGGNNLEHLPQEIGHLQYLQSLSLSDNKLERLPESLASLSRLRVLHLHQNRLTTLPHGLMFLTSLEDLSLRDNPLVMRFLRDMELQPASLLELSARMVKLHNVQYDDNSLPASLTRYLDTACECVNPACDGVYFNHRVEHVKFTDFCGKYRVPLLQYLCSSHCSAQVCGLHDQDEQSKRLPLSRVLLG